jgi:hypothetical protein
MTVPILYAIFSLLAVACVVGWRVESARAKAWQLDPEKRAPKSVKRFHAVGDGQWVVLGISNESSFENVSANPEVLSEGFSLRDESGAVVQVPKGTKVTIRGLDGARRAPLDAITTGGEVKPRFTFEVPPELALYTFDPDAKRSIGPYRGGAAAIVRGDKPFFLAGEPSALVGTLFPGCWLIVLFSFVGGGAIAAAFGLVTLAWVAAGAAAFLLLAGYGALPEPPPS